MRFIAMRCPDGMCLVRETNAGLQELLPITDKSSNFDASASYLIISAGVGSRGIVSDKCEASERTQRWRGAVHLDTGVDITFRHCSGCPLKMILRSQVCHSNTLTANMTSTWPGYFSALLIGNMLTAHRMPWKKAQCARSDSNVTSLGNTRHEWRPQLGGSRLRLSLCVSSDRWIFPRPVFTDFFITSAIIEQHDRNEHRISFFYGTLYIICQLLTPLRFKS